MYEKFSNVGEKRWKDTLTLMQK